MDTEKESYLSFALNNEQYAISVHQVLEVLEETNITTVPNTADYVLGVINFRGEILTIIDTRMKLNIGKRPDDELSVIIVMDINVMGKMIKLGAVVDQVKDVLEIDEATILDLPETIENKTTEYITGIYKVDEEMIMMLDINKVFFVEELNAVSEVY